MKLFTQTILLLLSVTIVNGRQDRTEIPSASPSSSRSPTTGPTVSFSPTLRPSLAPSLSSRPTITLSSAPSWAPSVGPSPVPSVAPSFSPTSSRHPSAAPSLFPSVAPTSSRSPSSEPSSLPSIAPSTSIAPSEEPSQVPSVSPTQSSAPSEIPSSTPSIAPSTSVAPSDAPSVSMIPSALPSDNPSASPSVSTAPSVAPSSGPSETPSDRPAVLTTVDLPSFELEVEGPVESSFVTLLEQYFLEGFEYDTLVEVDLTQQSRRLQESTTLNFDGEATFNTDQIPSDIDARFAALLLDLIGDDIDGVRITAAAIAPEDEGGDDRNVAAIVGGVGGAAIAAVLLALIIIYYVQRRSESPNDIVDNSSPVRSPKALVTRSLELEPTPVGVKADYDPVNVSTDSSQPQPPPPSKDDTQALIAQLSFDSSVGVGATNASSVFRQPDYSPGRSRDPPAVTTNLSSKNTEGSMAGYSLGSVDSKSYSKAPPVPAPFNPYGKTSEAERVVRVVKSVSSEEIERTKSKESEADVAVDPLKGAVLGAVLSKSDDEEDEPGRIVKPTPKKQDAKAANLAAALDDIGTLDNRLQAKAPAQEYRSPQAARLAEYLKEKDRYKKKEPEI